MSPPCLATAKRPVPWARSSRDQTSPCEGPVVPEAPRSALPGTKVGGEDEKPPLRYVPCRRSPRRASVASFAAIYLIWGSTFLAIRWAVETIPPFPMMAMRCLLGGGVLLALSRMREPHSSWPTARQWLGASGVGVLLFVGCHGLLAREEQHVPLGVAALFLATIPLFVPLLAWALTGSRPSLAAHLRCACGRIRRRRAAGGGAGRGRRQPVRGRLPAAAAVGLLLGGRNDRDPVGADAGCAARRRPLRPCLRAPPPWRCSRWRRARRVISPSPRYVVDRCSGWAT